MAWYNPQKVQFNPNAQIAQQAGAVGNFLQQKADSDYQKMLKERENQRLAEQFDYTKEQNRIKNDHWQQNFDQQEKQNEYANLLKAAQMGQIADNYILNKDKLDFQKKQAEAKKKEAEAKIAKQNTLDFINGLVKLQGNQKLGQQLGAINQTVDTQHPVEANEYTDRIAGFNPPTPNYNTTYDKEKVQLIGASDIPISSSGGKALKEVKAGDYTLLVDPITGKTVRKIETSTEFTPSKIKQKYVQMAKAGKDMADSFDAIVNNYSTKFTGPVDSILHDAIGQYVPWGNKGQAVFKSHLENLKLISKKLEEMGASFSVTEQQMIKDLMGGRYKDDGIFKIKFLEYMKIMRGKANSLVDSSDLAKYKTGNLKSILSGMDRSIANAEKKWGLGGQNVEVKPIFDNTQSPQVKAIVQRFKDEDGRIVVKMADGSMKYE